MRLLTAVVLLLIGIGTDAGRPRIGIEGVPDFDMPPNKDIKIPNHIKVYDDDEFWKELKNNDVIVMYLREQHCPDCDFYAEHFYNATKELIGVEGISTGQIDIHDEGDIFMDWHAEDEDIPALLVFKTSDSIKYKKKPIQFVVNSRIIYDLVPFVNRMLGPNAKHVKTNDQLDEIISNSNTISDGLLFTLWIPDGTSDKSVKISTTLFDRVAEQERYNSLFVTIGSEIMSSAASTYLNEKSVPYPCIISLETQYSPPKIGIFKIPMKGDFKNTIKQAKHWVYLEKPKRIGHKYDNKNGYFQDDLFIPNNHTEKGVLKVGDIHKQYVKVGVEARSSYTKVLLIKREVEFVTNENMTMVGIERGIVGMSQGMRRMLVLPHDQWSGWSYSHMEDIHNSVCGCLYIFF